MTLVGGMQAVVKRLNFSSGRSLRKKYNSHPGSHSCSRIVASSRGSYYRNATHTMSSKKAGSVATRTSAKCGGRHEKGQGQEHCRTHFGSTREEPHAYNLNRPAPELQCRTSWSTEVFPSRRHHTSPQPGRYSKRCIYVWTHKQSGGTIG